MGRFGRLTCRGALMLAPADDLVPVAYETGFRGGWSHAVALCLTVGTALVPGPEVVTPLGPDLAAARPTDREAFLFDLGLGLPQGSACLRTRDPRILDNLWGACGGAAFAPGSPVPGLLVERRLDVVMTTRLGRIEVFGGPVGSGAAAPRAYVAPEVVRARRTHAATAPIPSGLVPCAHLHPPHPCRDANERPIAFDRAHHDAFQALLTCWGDPGRVALKARLLAGEALPKGSDRADRGVARVVAAQADFIERAS
ncbi:hypothetical protein ASF27_04465 [Methylobacterium sp. Leaf102]|uniref:DUF6925 family protein n=1 Tax=unclassified Methylobacterium TaxID=2615210 RepID=UPI0006FD728C|nr:MULTISPECIES: hypothetical protein [unclassified Methylobacterium]KQP30204.1 hypothetical protein ASF27_04465 [Methylobacterium sp. Leaf102]KQP32133.1 hypothetical protein ASF25_04260 [Methylobacterium sp. Leaf100]